MKCDASKKRVRDATPSSSTQVAKQQKYWLPPQPFRQPYQQKSKGGSGSSHPPNPGFQNKTSSQAPRSSAPYHRPLSEVACNKCQQKGHYANKCLNQRRLPPPPPPVRSASTAVVKHNPKHAKVNLMNAAQAEDSSNVIMGNLPINDVPAKVLFDTGASHSFISRWFVDKFKLSTVALKTPILVSSPGAEAMASRGCFQLPLTIGRHVFPTDLIILESQGLDVILGMD